MKKNRAINFIKYAAIAIIILLFVPEATKFLYKYLKPQNSPIQVADSEISVAVTWEPTNGLTEDHLKDPAALEIIEEISIEKLTKRCEQAYYAQGGTGKFEAIFDTESWCVTVKNKNFAILRINYKDTIQLTSIMGIKDNMFVKISGLKTGDDLVPHSYGPCAEKMKEIFGFSFSDILNNSTR